MNWIKSSALPEIIAHIKRQSKSFTRGLSRFRGVSKNAHGTDMDKMQWKKFLLESNQKGYVQIVCKYFYCSITI